ncbi:MAG: chromate transporter, partial [Acholeplasmatales bacterium]|nr:chromate transporter [Acholeplasmatales bacterium]
MEELNKEEFKETSYVKKLVLLCLLFFKLGIVNFGGGYALLPLLNRELVDKRHWATEQELADYYAVGQCTPGAIAVNVSTFIGYKVAGMLGGILATLSFVMPAFFIIFIIASLLTNFSSNPFVVNALAGINVVVFILILSAIFKLARKSIVDIWGIILAVIVTFLSIFVSQIPLYVYIIAAAVIGFFINQIKEKAFEKKYRVKDEAKDKTKEEISTDSKENQVVEETKKEEAKENKSLVKNDVLMFIFGALTGIVIGLFGIIPAIFIKNKKYRNGVIITSFFWIIIAICLIVLWITGNNTFFLIYFNFF